MPGTRATRCLRGCFTPWWRARNWALAGLPVSMALSGWSAWATLTDEPGSAAPYAKQLAALIEEHQPGEPGDPDGWPLVMRAVERYQEIEAEVLEWADAEVKAERLGEGHPEGEDPTEDIGLFWPAISDHAGYIDSRGEHKAAIRAAIAEQAYLRFIADPEFNALLQHISESRRFVHQPRASALAGDFFGNEQAPTIRNIARLLALRLSREANESTAMARALAAGLAHAQAIDGRLSLMAMLNADSIRNLLLREVIQGGLAGRFDEETCLALLDVLAKAPRPTSLPTLIEAERIGSYAGLASVYTKWGFLSHSGITWPATPGNLALFQVAEDQEVVFRLQTPFMPRIEHARGHVDDVLDRLVHFIESPDASTFLRAADRTPPPHIIDLTILSYGYMNSMERRQQSDLARLVLAIEAHRLRHGELPDTLDRLVPEFLDALPQDPYNPAQTFRYAVLDEPDDFGRPYWLHNRAGIIDHFRHRDWSEEYTQLNAMNTPVDFATRNWELSP